MTEEMIEKASSHTKNLTASIKSMGDLVGDSIRQLTALNVDMMSTYCEIGYEQMRTLWRVRSSESLKDFSKEQQHMLERTRKHMVEDAMKLADFASQLRTELETHMRDSIAQVVPGAKKKSHASEHVTEAKAVAVRKTEKKTEEVA